MDEVQALVSSCPHNMDYVGMDNSGLHITLQKVFGALVCLQTVKYCLSDFSLWRNAYIKVSDLCGIDN